MRRWRVDEMKPGGKKQAAVLERALRPDVKQENNLLSPVCRVHRKNRRGNNLFILLRDTRASLTLFCKDFFFTANRKCKLTSLRMWRAASRSFGAEKLAKCIIFLGIYFSPFSCFVPFLHYQKKKNFFKPFCFNPLYVCGGANVSVRSQANVSRCCCCYECLNDDRWVLDKVPLWK